jgi:hypothetical protein
VWLCYTISVYIYPLPSIIFNKHLGVAIHKLIGI